jgi:SAM-dependent methyltransferase
VGNELGVTEQPPEWPDGAFERIDGAEDAQFYVPPRLVTHIDDNAIAALGEFYAKVLPRGAVLLDLMSSWVSHLPEDFPVAEVTGHGMNAAELAANPRLARWFVADLNQSPLLPLEDASVDAAMCCVSVQYLTRPVEVFAEVRRVLRPGGTFVVSYSNRCFPTKAVAVWRSLDDRSHAALVHLYFERAGFTQIAGQILANGMYSDPLYALTGTA